jgi:hypothetical protein
VLKVLSVLLALTAIPVLTVRKVLPVQKVLSVPKVLPVVRVVLVVKVQLDLLVITVPKALLALQDMDGRMWRKVLTVAAVPVVAVVMVYIHPALVEPGVAPVVKVRMLYGEHPATKDNPQDRVVPDIKVFREVQDKPGVKVGRGTKVLRDNKVPLEL